MALVIQHSLIAKSGFKKPKEDIGIEDSGFLMAISYDPDVAQMTVTMKGGSQYTYSSIDPVTFERFKQSRNKGKFYSDEIRGKEKASRVVNKTIGKPVSQKTKK